MRCGSGGIRRSMAVEALRHEEIVYQRVYSGAENGPYEEIQL